VVNPADESIVAEVAFGGRADAERAIEAAAAALPDWRRRTAHDRGQVLKRVADTIRRRADELARTLTLEQGKPLPEARGEILHTADTFEWFAEEGKRAYGRIIPAPHPHKRLHVLKHPIVATGSTAVGKQLLRRSADQVKKLGLELGGHAPLIVFPDADVEVVARLAVQGKFRNNGQVCIAPSRFYVHESVRRDFTEAAVELTRGLRLGPGLEDGVNVGPMIEPRFVANAQRLVEDARRQGAVVLTGGDRPARFAKGFYFEPTVVDHVDRSMALMREEPFAPVMPLAGFDDVDRVIAEANDTPYGLAAYVFTNDLNIAARMAEGLEAGIIGINDPVPTAVPAPFGGMKESGLGRELGQEGLDAYFETKFVSIGIRAPSGCPVAGAGFLGTGSRKIDDRGGRSC
jgi:acyl-CoA reductase-like NAD-dependent aldehyde dehydrogenase